MREPQLVVRQLADEQRAFWRNRGGAFFTVAFPLVLLVVFATMNARNEVATLHVRYVDYYVPSMLAFGVMGACFTNLATVLCLRRQSGYLKRLRGTPMRPAVFFGGLVGSSTLVAGLLATVILLTGALGYHVPLPRHWLALAGVLVIGAASFCTMAAATTCVVPDGEAAPAILGGLFYTVVFVSGAFYPVPPHSALSHVAAVFPVRHLIDATYAAFGTGPGVDVATSLGDLAVVAAWGACALPLALLRFRWEPRPR